MRSNVYAPPADAKALAASALDPERAVALWILGVGAVCIAGNLLTEALGGHSVELLCFLGSFGIVFGLTTWVNPKILFESHPSLGVSMVRAGAILFSLILGLGVGTALGAV